MTNFILVFFIKNLIYVDILYYVMYSIMCKEVNMDSQLKKGFLEYCVLAALRQDDSYGYKIVKDVSNYIEISESTLYPILKRLEGSGFVSTYSTEHNGRLRKYYHITDEGKVHIDEFLKTEKDVKRIYKFVKGEF